MDSLKKVEAAQHTAAQIVAECIETGLPPKVAVLNILLENDMAGIPLPEDVLAWASKGRLKDDDYLPADRPKSKVLLRRYMSHPGR